MKNPNFILNRPLPVVSNFATSNFIIRENTSTPTSTRPHESHTTTRPDAALQEPPLRRRPADGRSRASPFLKNYECILYYIYLCPSYCLPIGTPITSSTHHLASRCLRQQRKRRRHGAGNPKGRKRNSTLGAVAERRRRLLLLM